MGVLGPSPRFPAVATQSLPITSGEGSSLFLHTSLLTPTPSPGVQKRPMGNSGHDKATESSMEEGQPSLLTQIYRERERNLECTRGAGRDGVLDKALKGKSFWRPSKQG